MYVRHSSGGGLNVAARDALLLPKKPVVAGLVVKPKRDVNHALRSVPARMISRIIGGVCRKSCRLTLTRHDGSLLVKASGWPELSRRHFLQGVVTGSPKTVGVSGPAGFRWRSVTIHVRSPTMRSVSQNCIPAKGRAFPVHAAARSLFTFQADRRPG